MSDTAMKAVRLMSSKQEAKAVIFLTIEINAVKEYIDGYISILRRELVCVIYTYAILL